MAKLVFALNQSLDGYVDHLAMTPEETVAFTQAQQKTWRPILQRIAGEAK